MRPSRETIGERTRKHGMANTRLYAAWCGMKLRCYNSHYKHFDRYGGRGIKVCDEWKNSFEPFRDWALQNGYIEGVSGKEQSLDRIDVDGNYCPENCRWTNFLTQARNRGDTVYVYDGDKKIIAREFAKDHGITNYVFVFRHAKQGDSAQEIIERWNKLHPVKR